jgi:ribosomal protein L44E
MDGSVARFHLMQNDEWRMQNGKETAEAKRRQVAAATKKTKEQKDSRGNSREKAQKEIRLRTACLRCDEEGVRWFRVG